MTQTEALKLALEALDSYGINDYSDYVIGKHETHIIDNAITAIKEALMSQSDGAQPAVSETHKQEPVAFYRCNGCGYEYQQMHPTSCDCMKGSSFEQVNYYTAPPQRTAAEGEDTRRAWVNATTWRGLTSEEIRQLEKENTVNGYHGDYCPTWDLIQATEAKLREKNTSNGVAYE